MHVKVKRVDLKSGERKDGKPYDYASAVVIFPDNQTAAQLFIPEEVIDPCKIEVNKVYDLYRDDKGYCLVFDEVPAK